MQNQPTEPAQGQGTHPLNTRPTSDNPSAQPCHYPVRFGLPGARVRDPQHIASHSGIETFPVSSRKLLAVPASHPTAFAGHLWAARSVLKCVQSSGAFAKPPFENLMRPPAKSLADHSPFPQGKVEARQPMRIRV